MQAAAAATVTMFRDGGLHGKVGVPCFTVSPEGTRNTFFFFFLETLGYSWLTARFVMHVESFRTH